MIPDSHLDLVTGKSFAHVATIGPDGQPHSSPVWIAGDAQTIKFSQTTDRQKYDNLQREPRLALSMIDIDNPYRYLEVRGRVSDIIDDDDNGFIDSMAQKYLGEKTYPNHQPGDHRVVVTVDVEHTTQMG
jgi:PPOX class probable F420-dependent enzyme